MPSTIVREVPRVSVAVLAEALFASPISESDRLAPGQVLDAALGCLARLGVHGCVAVVAQEAGDHPELFLRRMRWALDAVVAAGR